MKVLINGLGNIGVTVANLCLDFKELLAIDEVYVYKNLPEIWLEQDIELLREKGAIVCSAQVNTLDSIAKQIDYIFECRDHDTVQSTPHIYQKFNHLKGVVAQGSETNHGVPIMIGVNSELAHNQPRVHVVSCNSHGIASVLQAFAGSKLEDLVDADIVVVRRSEDVSASKKLVGANVIVRHCDPDNGTHHATDVHALFQTMETVCPISTSDINTPSQLLHAIRFNVKLRRRVEAERVRSLIERNTFCATTEKFDSHKIFELGRRYGMQGRIFSHAIICTSSIMLQGECVKGWAFVPQEGNSILSTIEAYLQQTDHPNRQSVIEELKKKLLRGCW